MVSAGARGKLQAATVNMVSDLVRQVGGDHVEVTEIMGPVWIRIYTRPALMTSLSFRTLKSYFMLACCLKVKWRKCWREGRR